MKTLSAILLILLFGFPIAVRSQDIQCDSLWAATCVGMSIEEVLKVVPQSRKKIFREGDRLGNGAAELVNGPAQEISGQTFIPRFYFLNERLHQVTLGLEGVDSTHAAELTFEGLIPALRSKYGTEVSTKSPKAGLLYMREMTWFHLGTNISMVLIAVGSTSPVLNIVYQRRVAGDASRL